MTDETDETVECSISGDALWAFRIRGLKKNLRAFGVSFPMLVVITAYGGDDAGIALLFLVPVITTLTSGFNAWRWLREMKRPGFERFIVDGHSIVRQVGESVIARMQLAHIRVVFRSERSVLLRGHLTIEIPSTSDRFASLIEALSTKCDVQMNTSLFSVSRLGLGLFGLLAVMTLLMAASYDGMLASACASSGIGLVLAELTWRLSTRFSRSRPMAF